MKKRRLNKAKMRRKRWIGRGIIIVVPLAVVSLASFGVSKLLGAIFAVRDIYATGSVYYDKEEIAEASGIKKGDNLMFLDTQASEKKICRELPYIESAKVTKSMPNGVKIETQIAKPRASLVSNNEYFLVNKDFKVLEKKSEPTPEVIDITGANFSISEENEIIFEDKDDKKIIDGALNSFEVNSLYGLKSLDISDKNNIGANYAGRVKINFGGKRDFDYKALTAHELLKGKIREEESGVLDLSKLGENNRSYFTVESSK